MDSDSDSDCEFEVCSRDGRCCGQSNGSDAAMAKLPFDPTSLENLILAISDKFDFRVVLNDERTRGALLMTAGLTIAGGFIGRHYGGKMGAAVGGAIGGACGLGIVGKCFIFLPFITGNKGHTLWINIQTLKRGIFLLCLTFMSVCVRGIVMPKRMNRFKRFCCP